MAQNWYTSLRPPDPSNLMKKPIQVLIVEDSKLIRTGLMKFLERYEEFDIIATGENGEEAVSRALSLKPELILMDIRMPKMDGIEATRVIKRLLPKTRVLILTSFSDDDEVFGAFSAGADGYCLKGITMEKLTLAMKAVSDGVSWLDPGIAERVLNTINEPRSTVAQAEVDFSPPMENTVRDLPPLEKRLLQLVGEGFDGHAISLALDLPYYQVDICLREIFQKLSITRDNDQIIPSGKTESGRESER